MSATLISNNTTIKFDSKVGATNVAKGTIYTVPAGKFLEFHASFTASGGSGGGLLTIDGVTVASISNSRNYPETASTGGSIGHGNLFKAGPGAVIATSSTDGATAVQTNWTGCLFTNTP